MADRFLTISEAADFTGKSRSTLRRFIDGIVKADASPDRHLLTPNPEEVAAFHAQNQPFAWKLNEELLRRQFLKPDDVASDAGEEGSGGAPGNDFSRLVVLLEKTNALLERELSEKNSQIAAMNERLRESNVLMKELQQRLALPSGKPVDAQTRSEPLDVSNSAGDSKKPKKGFFRKIFGA